MHKLLTGLLSRLHQVCGKMFFFTTYGIVVEKVVLHKLISFNFLFYSIYVLPYLIYVITQGVRSYYICKVLDVMAFVFYFVYLCYSIFYLLCCH